MASPATEPHPRPIDKLALPADNAPARAPEGDPEGGARLPRHEAKRSEQYLSAECEARRLTLLRDTANRWSARAREATTEASYTYAANRSASLRRTLRTRMAQCSTVLYTLRCRGGRTIEMPRPCRQWWVCGRCRRRRANGLRMRIMDGLALAWHRATAGGVRCALRLTTLTVRHSGDLVADRARLADAWRRFYKRLHEWVGRFAYVGCWEVTPGRDGRGHPHLHIAWIGPRFISYGGLLALWRAAIDDAGARINHVTSRGTVESCANYLGKYLSKGVELGGFTDELRAQTLAAFYNAHLVLTSHKFWGPKECGCCGGRWRRVVGSWVDAGGRDHRDGAPHVGADADPGDGYPRCLPGIERAPPGRCRL